MKTILVTGATGAIGRAACEALAERDGIHLVMLARDPLKLSELKNSLPQGRNIFSTLVTDLSDLNSVRDAVTQVRGSYPNLHALVNVASVFKAKRTLSSQQHELMFATNHLGPYLLTTRLLPLLRRTPGSKVITVAAPSTSRLDFNNLNSEKRFSSLQTFGSTKMMNLLMAFGLSASFKDADHASMAFHPGLVRSELLRESPMILRKLIHTFSSTPEQTGKALADLVLTEDARSQNGKFYNKRLRELIAAPHAYDRVLQHKLWKASESLASTTLI